jgi:hypothetical protein
MYSPLDANVMEFHCSLFTTTALIAVFTVAAPQLMPCPVSNGLANDEKKEKEQAE